MNVFDALTSSLEMAEEIISELEDISMATSKTEKQREKNNSEKKKKKTRTEYPKTCVNYKKCNIHIMRVPKGGRDKGIEEISEAIMMRISQLMLDTK